VLIKDVKVQINHLVVIAITNLCVANEDLLLPVLMLGFVIQAVVHQRSLHIMIVIVFQEAFLIEIPEEHCLVDNVAMVEEVEEVVVHPNVLQINVL